MPSCQWARQPPCTRGSSPCVQLAPSSSLTQFFIAGLALAIAVGGAVINFNLIALPMSEMVGGGSYIGEEDLRRGRRQGGGCGAADAADGD